jgi:hypothetical protein
VFLGAARRALLPAPAGAAQYGAVPSDNVDYRYLSVVVLLQPRTHPGRGEPRGLLRRAALFFHELEGASDLTLHQTYTAPKLTDVSSRNPIGDGPPSALPARSDLIGFKPASSTMRPPLCCHVLPRQQDRPILYG